MSPVIPHLWQIPRLHFSHPEFAGSSYFLPRSGSHDFSHIQFLLISLLYYRWFPEAVSLSHGFLRSVPHTHFHFRSSAPLHDPHSFLPYSVKSAAPVVLPYWLRYHPRADSVLSWYPPAGCGFPLSSVLTCWSVPLILRSHGFFREDYCYCGMHHLSWSHPGLNTLPLTLRYEGNNDSSLPVWLQNQYSLWRSLFLTGRQSRPRILPLF